MWTWNKKSLVAATLIGAGFFAQSTAFAGQKCLTLKQMHSELVAQGINNLEENKMTYDENADGLDKVDKATLAQEVKASRYPSIYPLDPAYTDPFLESNSDDTACKPGEKITIPAAKDGYPNTPIWRIISSSENSLKLQALNAGSFPETAQKIVLELRRLGNARYEMYWSDERDSMNFIHLCTHDASQYDLVKNYTWTLVSSIGPKGTVPEQLPIAPHMQDLFMKAVLAEPNPICPKPTMQNASYRKDLPAENLDGGGPGGCCRVNSNAGTAQ